MTIAVALAVWCAAPVQACPGCRTTGEMVRLQEPQTIEAGMALSWSVLFLLVVVGGVLSVLGFLIAKTIRRLESERPKL